MFIIFYFTKLFFEIKHVGIGVGNSRIVYSSYYFPVLLTHFSVLAGVSYSLIP